MVRLAPEGSPPRHCRVRKWLRPMLLAALVTGPTANAAVYSWDTNTATSGAQGGSGAWNATNLFWWTGSANVAWAAGNDAVFGAAAGTVTVDGPQSANKLQFDTAGYLLTGGTVQLTGTALTVNQDATINSALTSAGSVSKTGTGELTIGGNLGLNGNLTIANSTSGGGIILGPGAAWNVTGDIVQSGSIGSSDRYQPSLLTKGLHFANGTTTHIYNKYRGSDLNADPVLGVDAANTTVVYHGFWVGDGGNQESHVTLTNGGRLVIAADSTLDFINDAYFTRQMWVYGDGTGILEFEEGFVSDRTNGGTTPLGIGSIRLGNVTFITHHTQSLPVAARPNALSGSGLNGHFPFESAPGGRWKVMTNDQDYKGGFWIYVNMTIETIANATHSGVTSVWSDYTNPGGFMTRATGLTVTKEGPAALNLDGEQSYLANSTMWIKAGTVNFNTDPTNPTAYNPSGTGGQYLTVQVDDTGTANFAAPLARVENIIVNSGGVARVPAGTQKVTVTKGLTLNGTGRLDINSGFVLDYSGASPIATIQAQLLSGYSSGAWNGSGIMSSSAAASASTGLGYAEASALGISSFHGYSVDATSIVIKYTLAGDSDLDGTVNFTDLLAVSQNYNASGRDWFRGDFDYDGTVNFSDLLKLGQNYNQMLPAPAAAVPEPGTGLILALAALALRRRRSNRL